MVAKTNTSFLRMARLSAGTFVRSVQFVVVKSEFCCKTKSIEGTTQEMTALPPESAMLNNGVDVDCEV